MAAGYTATDDGLGVTEDSVRAWVNKRTRRGVFVHAEVCGVADAAGPDYPDWDGRPTPPTLVLTDEQGRSLALNGTPGGFDGSGPRAAAQILLIEGLLPADNALRVVTDNRALSLRLTTEVHLEDRLLDVVALHPDTLTLWSAHQFWREPCRQLDPRLPADPHYPALAAALDRMDADGVDAQRALTLTAGVGPLPARHPGRTLHARLAVSSEAAATRAPPPAPGDC